MEFVMFVLVLVLGVTIGNALMVASQRRDRPARPRDGGPPTSPPS